MQYGHNITYRHRKKVYTFPANKKIYCISVFAGGRSAPKFRNAYFFADKYGGNANEWYKVKGFTYANEQLLEIHWVEHKKYGRYKGKIKDVLNKESYQNKGLLSFLLSKEDI